MKCKKCEKNYRRLTKDDLCAYCSYKINGEWPKEFSDVPKKK